MIDLKGIYMRIDIRRRDVLWNYLGTIFTLTINILILPLLIKFLDGAEVGLWYTFVSIGGITALFDFGFAATLARNITYCLSGASKIKATGKADSNGEIDKKLLSEILGTCKIIYLIIAILALVLMLFIGTPYVMYIIASEFDMLYLYSWAIYAFAIVLNLLFYYYTSLLRGVGDISGYNKAVVISRIIQIIIAVSSLLMGFGILGMSLSYFAYSISFRFFTSYIIRLNHPIFKKSKIKISNCVETFRLVWHNAWRDGIVSISNYLTTYGMTLLCSGFLSLTESGIYSVSFQIANGISVLATVFFNSLQPSMQSNYVSNNNIKLQNQYVKSIIFFIFIYVIVAFLVLTIGIPVLKVIKPDYIINKLFLLLVLINCFFIQYHNMNASFISNTNEIPYTKSFIITSVINMLLISFALKFTNFGLWCIPVIQFVVQSMYNNWKWPNYAMKIININFSDIFKCFIKQIKKY